jgi:ankyrin repeat protein
VINLSSVLNRLFLYVHWKQINKYAECNGHSDIVSYMMCPPRTLVSRRLTSGQSNVSLFDVDDCDTSNDLLSQDADGENCDGLRPLHFAARRGLVDLALLLIDFGGTVHATDSAGNTPLHEAVRQGLEIT